METQPGSTPLEGRSTLINAAITLILMAILAIAAFLFKMRAGEARGLVPDGESREVADSGEGGVSEGGALSGTTGHLLGNAFPTVLPHCVLVENRANDGDSFRIRYAGQERVFDLYLADAPEITLSYGEKLEEQSAYFGGADEETVVRIGEEAKSYALDLLRTCPFTVFTSWEQVPGTARYYAFIVVEHQPGKRCFLSELLVLRGYARPTDIPVTMPAGSADFESFRKTMANYEQRARLEKAGGWGIIEGRMPTRRATPVMVPASG